MISSSLNHIWLMILFILFISPISLRSRWKRSQRISITNAKIKRIVRRTHTMDESIFEVGHCDYTETIQTCDQWYWSHSWVHYFLISTEWTTAIKLYFWLTWDHLFWFPHNQCGMSSSSTLLAHSEFNLSVQKHFSNWIFSFSIHFAIWSKSLWGMTTTR